MIYCTSGYAPQVKAATHSRPKISLRACTVDLDRGVAERGEDSLKLTRREVELLAYLADRTERTVSREELLVKVWGYAPSVVSRAVDTTVRRLREKIEADPQRPDHLITSFGAGYRLLLEFARLAPIGPEEEPFVGRRDEVEQLLAELRPPGRARAVLLQGAAGVGKTRLAQHLAHRLAGELRGGRVLIDLTERRDLAGVAVAAAAALQLEPRGSTGSSLLVQAGAVLRGRGPCLVVLDNCEGVGEGAAFALSQWKELAPEARFVATSREELAQVDLICRLAPLTPPDALSLFEALVQRVRPGFRVDEDNRAVVEQLMERLEHLPLAISLAAGRAAALSPQALLARLDDRFRLLASRERDGTARHRTLRASLDASWELLDAPLRAAFAACSAFRGGFDLGAARVVVGQPEGSVLLDTLCRRSLLEQRGERFGGYAFVREYATERLAEDPELERAVLRRHAEVYHQRWSQTQTADRPVVLSVDVHNLLAAVERSVQHGWTDLLGGLALGLLDVVGREGPFELGLEVASQALAVPALALREQIILGMRLGSLQQWTGRGEALSTVSLALQRAEALGDADLLASALCTRAVVVRTRGDATEALADLQRAFEIAQRGGQLSTWTNCTITLAGTLRELGDSARARELFTRAVMEGDEDNASQALMSLAMLERRQGRFDEARALYEQARGRKMALGDLRGVALAMTGLGNLELELGRLPEARVAYEEGLQLATRVGVSELAARVWGNLGLLERLLGDLDTARSHLERAQDTFERLGEARMAAHARGNLGAIELACGHPAMARALLQDCLDKLGILRDPVVVEHGAALIEALVVLGELDTAEEQVQRLLPAAQALGEPLPLGLVLARRALLQRARGLDPSEALRAAEACAVGLGPLSELRRVLVRVQLTAGSEGSTGNS
jgi:predicted ATPase/DNA-binding winged helix-turn-helix (wHTH) protein